MAAKSGGSSGTKSGGSAAGKTTSKGASSAPEKKPGGGLFSGLGAIFSGGGNRAQGAPTASDRPMARPGIVSSGKGAERVYTDTKTGQTFKEPEYRGASFKGLTSTDPANVVRNRMAAQMYARQAAERPERGGIASLTAAPSFSATAPTMAPGEMAPGPGPAPVNPLTQIGAPSTPMAPVEVATPTYGMTAGTPGPNYGMAFTGTPGSYNPYQNMTLMDIFAMYPNLMRGA